VCGEALPIGVTPRLSPLLSTMVRMIAPATESAHDLEIPSRAEVDPEALKDARRAEVSTGFRDRVRLPLNYGQWGCGGPFQPKWGFHEAYPVLLRDNLPREDWNYALARINSGYLGSVWPKLVWTPFWTCMLAGAIVEGACEMSNEGSPVPFGTILGTLVAAGLLASLILSQISYAMVKKDLDRISTTCSILTEQFRDNHVTFQLLVANGRRVEARLDIKVHVSDVDVEHVTLDVDEYTGAQDKHLIHVDSSGERVVVYSTSRRKPTQSLGAGEVYRYGFGKEDLEREVDSDDEDFIREMRGASKKSHQPHGGYCGCKEEMRDAVLKWKSMEESMATQTIHVWRNQRFKSCPNCALPIYEPHAHRLAVANRDVSSLADEPDRENEHLARNFIYPNPPKIQPFEFETDCCGKGWSAGMLSGACEDTGTIGETLILPCCLVSEVCVLLEGRTTAYDHFGRYMCCCLLAIPCNGCILAQQRLKIRRMYNIDISQAPFGEICDGHLHDFCVAQVTHLVLLRRKEPIRSKALLAPKPSTDFFYDAQTCPCLVNMQHVNHLKLNEKVRCAIIAFSAANDCPLVKAPPLTQTNYGSHYRRHS